MVDNNSQDSVVNYWRLDEWFPDLNSEVTKKLKVFYEEIVKHNKTHSLISMKTLPLADALHFSDCILATRIILRAHPGIKEITDIGSGAGFPGLVFAILNPQIQVRLLDSDPKKLEFLSNISKQLGVTNVQVVNQNIEVVPEGSLHFCMVRGFGNISRTCMSARKAVKKGGVLFHLKSEEWALEVSEMPSQLCSLWSPSLVGDYKLPIGAVKFSVIKTEKIQ